MFTSHSINECLQVITAVIFNCVAAVHGAH